MYSKIFLKYHTQAETIISFKIEEKFFNKTKFKRGSNIKCKEENVLMTAKCRKQREYLHKKFVN